MNKYIYIYEGEVSGFVDEWDQVFPDIPIDQRYSKEYLDKCVVRTEEEIAEQGIHAGMLYDKETDTFSEKPEPEVPVQPEEPDVPIEEGFTITQAEADAAYREGVNDVE